MTSNTDIDANTMNPFTDKPYGANYYALRDAASKLPVSKDMDRVLQAIRSYSIVILEGATGSGKTTQLGQSILMESVRKGGDNEGKILKPGKKIALTQNRQLAAELVATRIAAEMDVDLGSTVGLSYRGRHATGPKTRLEVMTDGTLLTVAASDPLLNAYGVIIIDEAHQHSIPTDLLLGFLKTLSAQRKDLKVVIISATLDADMFMNFFRGAKHIKVPGREHKVQISYLAEPTDSENVVGTMVDIIFQVHLIGESGNILVFASGEPQISKILAEVRYRIEKRFSFGDIGPLSCYPLFAALSDDQKDKAVNSIAPLSQSGKLGRKLIVATNIAETSITIPGITHVIDSCMVKSKVCNPSDDSSFLFEQPISKASAQQRAGRAGRTRPGNAYRMVTEGAYHEQLLDHSVAAITECDMLSECLTILSLKRDPLTFPYIIAPATETVVVAYEILRTFSAIQSSGQLSDSGKLIRRLPINIYSAVALLGSPKFQCSGQVLSMISMMEASEGGRKLFVPYHNDEGKKEQKAILQSFSHPTSEHATLFNIYVSWRSASLDKTQDAFLAKNQFKASVLQDADRTRLQLLRILQNEPTLKWQLLSLPPTEPKFYETILMALAAGYFFKIAKRVPGTESRTKKSTWSIVRNGAMVDLKEKFTSLGPEFAAHDWIIFNEYIKGEDKHEIRTISALRPERIIQSQPNFWADPEFLPQGHIQDDMVKLLAKMTSKSEDFVRGGMPNIL